MSAQTADHAAAADEPQLSPEDARAVDLLLDRPAPRRAESPTSPATNAMTAINNEPGLADRVRAADGLLRLLDAMPAGDPPAALVSATMRRVEDARRSGPAVGMPAAAAGQPVLGQPAAGLGRGQPQSADPAE